MDYKINYIINEDYMSATTRGRINSGTFSGLPTAIISHPKWCPHMNIIVDHSHLIIDEIQVRQIKETAIYDSIFREQFSGSKIAMIVGSDAGYEYASKWQTLICSLSDSDIKIFRSLEKARVWLKE